MLITFHYYFLFFLFYCFFSAMDASHPEICFFLYTVIIPAATQETVEEAGIEHGTAALQSGSPSRLSQLSHHIPSEPPHPLLLTMKLDAIFGTVEL
jgi:hypothetical protein